MHRARHKLSILLILAFFVISSALAFALPFGATPTEITTSRATADAAGTHDAQAGNVTELTVTGVSITQAWQGYVGNVSGTISLEDSAGNVLYNWTLASPEGEIYAANDTITWTNIQCFNFTAAGSFADDSANNGSTSQFGLNVSQLETQYSILGDDVDGVNETFSIGGTAQHDEFFVGILNFTTNECPSTGLFTSTGQTVDNSFEEALLYDPDNRVPVFASILEEADTAGYNSENWDFEMIVLEDGHGSDTTETTYNFYVELQ